MIRRLAFAAEARRVHGTRRWTALREPVSAGEWLTIQECAKEAYRPRNGRTQAYAPVSPSQRD